MGGKADCYSLSAVGLCSNTDSLSLSSRENKCVTHRHTHTHSHTHFPEMAFTLCSPSSATIAGKETVTLRASLEFDVFPLKPRPSTHFSLLCSRGADAIQVCTMWCLISRASSLIIETACRQHVGGRYGVLHGQRRGAPNSAAGQGGAELCHGS